MKHSIITDIMRGIRGTQEDVTPTGEYYDLTSKMADFYDRIGIECMEELTI